MKLNAEQHAAVHHQGGPLLIVAGAGTGKTTVITERVKHLIQEKHVDPQHIFATTFTEKSASEMLKRLDEVMPLSYQEPWLGTFHALCDRLLRTEGLEMGLNPSFRVLTQTDQWIFVRKHLFDFHLSYYRPLGNPAKFISALIKLFSRLQDEDAAPEEFMAFTKTVTETAEKERLVELAQAYADYQALKTQESVVDFGDLLTLTLKLFRTKANILKKYQHQFEHVLVDEFQDTNYAQYELIKLLSPAKNNPNLIVVGDDDQSIYKFRGASVSNILEFKADYPKAKEVVLTQNYRSPQPLLDAAYTVIQHNNPDRLEEKLKLDKHLRAQSSEKDAPQVITFSHINNEVDWTVAEIKRLIEKESLSYQDVAILARANSQLEPYAAALKAAGIPYQVVSNKGLFDQEEIRPLLSFLRLIADPEDSISLFQFLQTHSFAFNPARLYQLLQTAHRNATSLWVELKTSEEPEEKQVVELIESFQLESKDHTTSQLLFSLINKTNYLKPYIDIESIEHQLKIKNINLLFQKIQACERTAPDQTLVTFLETLDLWLEAGENPPQAEIEDVDTITLMTVHAAKGLEYEAVFIGSLVSGRFPSSNRSDPIEIPDALVKETLPTGNAHLQEERRLFYVGVTRAKRYLYLTAASDYGGKKKWVVSGFVKETSLPAEDKSKIGLPQNESKATPALSGFKGNNIAQVSYSQIDAFLACPLRYKYRYILRIPAPPHHALSFGQTIHNTLEEFHRRQMQGNTPTLKELLDSYKRHFIDQGYESPQHKKERYQSGIAAMTAYYDQYQGIGGQPKLLEQSFKLKLTPAVTLTGKIDRIDTVNGAYHLVDYKTGNDKDQKEVDKDEQLTIYAIAAKEALGIDLASMSLYFIESGKKISTTRNAAQLTKAKETLNEQIDTMQHSEFPAKPGFPFPCGFCEYKNICPAAATQ